MERMRDLIDTQWNVNLLDCSQKIYRKSDLIDTQWNVNTIKDRIWGVLM